MPIYKTGEIKDGLQKYIVRINYFDDNGKPKQLTRISYGLSSANALELRLKEELKTKSEKAVKKITFQELFEEYIEVKTYEIRKRTVYNIQRVFSVYILPMFKDYFIDEITPKDIQNWKIHMEKKNLALKTKKRTFTFFSSMINYAVNLEYIQKNPLMKIGNFKDPVSIKPEMKIYAPEEFKKFIAVIKNLSSINFQFFRYTVHETNGRSWKDEISERFNDETMENNQACV